ncbi:uncharacterized protein LOC129583365 [Paramacrobiotus metropolitanus]|uniref:uncharacterized protein LOC129583365 n=1 Tax=Paramacrobiotus metropolitanus TaxID=2943436 RepID=UPI002445B99B|nr:uncharacterized protein LOC129583365 [Paramacrobiotus metropolitanus]
MRLMMAAISLRKSLRFSRMLRILSLAQISLGLLLLVVEIVGIVVIMLAAEDLAEWHMLTILLFCGILIASGGLGIRMTTPVAPSAAFTTEKSLRVQSRCMVAFLVLNIIAVILSTAAIVANALHLAASNQDYFLLQLNHIDPRRAAIHVSGLVCYAIFFLLCLTAAVLISPSVCCAEAPSLALQLGDRDPLEATSKFSTLDEKFVREKRSKSNLKVVDHIRSNNLAVAASGSAMDEGRGSTVNSQSTMVSDQSSVSLTGYVRRTPSAPSLDSDSTPSQSILKELDAILRQHDVDAGGEIICDEEK